MSRTVDPDRHLALEGCFNFRDLGGYRTVDGRTVRWRRLFRADGLSRLTEADLAHLADLGVATVIDLRTDGELAERAPVSPAGEFRPAVHHLPMIDVLPPIDEYPSWADDGFLVGRYAAILADGMGAIGRALTLLAAPGGIPGVFHCTAGKDRTGILAALVLGLAGVPDDDIVADYALSREAMVRMLEWLRFEHPEVAEELDRREDAILAVRPTVMARLIEHVRAEYGSFEGVAAAAGAAKAVEALRAALLDS